LDVALGGEKLFSPAPDLVVNMRGAPRIGHGFDGPKEVLAAGTSHETAETLKVLVALLGVAGAAVQVGAMGVTLPNLNRGISDWLSFGVKDAPADVGHLTDGGGGAVVDHQQIVVRIQGEMVRIEWSLGLGGSGHEGLGK